MATVTPIASHPRFKAEREGFIGKRQLSTVIGFSVKWIELRMRDDGLPYHRSPNGHARFLLSEVRPFVEEWRRNRLRGVS